MFEDLWRSWIDYRKIHWGRNRSSGTILEILNAKLRRLKLIIYIFYVGVCTHSFHYAILRSHYGLFIFSPPLIVTKFHNFIILSFLLLLSSSVFTINVSLLCILLGFAIVLYRFYFACASMYFVMHLSVDERIILN